MPALIFYCLIIISAALTIYGKYRNRSIVYFFKPLTTALIIAVPFVFAEVADWYAYLIIAGLMFSFAGDVLLLFPEKLFTAGLAAFLSAHLFFTAAFIISSASISIYPAVVFIVFSYFFYKKLDLRSSKFNYPVMIYIYAISLMCFFAVNLYIYDSHLHSGRIFIASILFLISDSFLAYNKFVRSFYPAEIIILSTYYSAVFLFALSVS